MGVVCRCAVRCLCCLLCDDCCVLLVACRSLFVVCCSVLVSLLVVCKLFVVSLQTSLCFVQCLWLVCLFIVGVVDLSC